MPEKTERNGAVVLEAFERWKAGKGTVFDLLDENVEWTIQGSRWPAGTYRGRDRYVTEIVTPLFEKLAASTVPKDIFVLAQDAQVVARWSQETPLKAGGVYSNRYAWFLTLTGDRVVQVDAFLDLDAYVAAVGGAPTQAVNL